MKIQHLAVIFIIIIMPITIVLSEYVNNKITTATKELEYDTKLLNSTYDSIKAYQLNTINNAFGDVTNSKIYDIEAAVNTFYSSLANNFNYTGYKSSVMKEYVPAVAFTLYDGYYIYSPFKNTLTGVDITEEDGDQVDYDKKYSKPNEITNGLKPYVYYSARYNYGNNDFIITYTLDNYITIQGQIGGDGEDHYVYDCGYLYPIGDNGIKLYQVGPYDNYIIDGITFWNPKLNRADSVEELQENVGGDLYSYVKINGKKYYLDESNGEAIEYVNYNGVSRPINKNARFFFINSKGNKDYNAVAGYDVDKDNFRKYYIATKYNKSAYEYYKKAYEFSMAVLGKAVDGYKDKAGKSQVGYYLGPGARNELNNRNFQSTMYNESDPSKKDEELKKAGITPISEYGDYKIFDGDIHSANSNFNKHRKAIIRYVVETNLAPAISSFKYSTKSTIDFVMPKISETDWDLIENNVCEITFLQGLNIGSKKYNGYSVVANTLTKEYIDEDDIYILTTNNTYCKANDSILSDDNIIKTIDFYNNKCYAGIWKINCERTQVLQDDGLPVYFYPIGTYLGSYTSIMGSSGINEIGTASVPDMYAYMSDKSEKLKKAYYYALGRERWGGFNINNINYEIYGNNGNEYFLKDYEL